MSIPRSLILAVLLPFSSLPGKYSIPPMEKSVEDESTGLNVPPGFEVDLVYKVDKKKYGSWIAMAFDGKGRLTVSDQGNASTGPYNVSRTLDSQSVKSQTIDPHSCQCVPRLRMQHGCMDACMGLCHKLYAS